MKRPRRAIALAGGGPAAGLHIGALRRLNEEADFDFQVWSLSCIGAWVGIVYNQFDDDKDLAKTESFFRNGVFRDDASYEKFPINRVFGADLLANWKALNSFIFDKTSYEHLILPEAIAEASKNFWSFFSPPYNWSEGDFNSLVLEMSAANPLIRYYTSMMYRSKIDGLSRIYYEDSSLLEQIDFKKLKEKQDTFIFHNAWNLDDQKLEQFANRPEEKTQISDEALGKNERPGYRQLSLQSLCACSALPFIEQTVKMNGKTYCEGALVDTVNFRRLLKEHKVDEIWVNRTVDSNQIRKPENIHDALGNLCQLFAATVGEDDVKLFEMHLEKETKYKCLVQKIPVAENITTDWNHSNLDSGIEQGYKAADEAVKEYREKETSPEPHYPS